QSPPTVNPEEASTISYDSEVGKLVGKLPRSSPVSVDVFDVSVLRRKRNIHVRESAYSSQIEWSPFAGGGKFEETYANLTSRLRVIQDCSFSHRRVDMRNLKA
ncbi:MAG: hypothetical protein WAM53_12450, partial [Terrimicrobiaceae bacterium]